MANAIVLDVVVAGTSSTTRRKNPQKNNCFNSEIIDNNCIVTNDLKSKKATHRIVDLVCKCLCHFVQPSVESSHSNLSYQLENNKNTSDTAIDSTNAISNATLDSLNSYASCQECSCVKITRKYSKFHSTESFSKLNISSSTAFENTSSGEVYKEDATTTTPPRNNCGALGILQEKRSPLFGPLTNTPSKGISLRSEKPFYSQNILHSQEDLAQLKTSSKKCKENIDFTATDALSMNGGRQLNSGAFAKSNGGFTDINRNGTQKNWVSKQKQSITL